MRPFSVNDRQHVYVVDDEKPVLTALVRSIEQAGYDVSAFESAEEFLQKAIRFRPAVLVLDMQMPGASGVQLQARLTEFNWDIPVIFISGHSTAVQGITAMKQGALDFLIKPFDLDKLLGLIEKAIQADLARLRASQARTQSLKALEVLRPREYEAYLCLVKGYSYAEMMAEMDISLPTAKTYRAAVMHKLKLASLAELIRFHQRLN